jgi:hypothetical protein
MKKLKIILNKNSVNLCLENNKALVDCDEFSHDANLSEQLLVRIEKLLEKSDLKISEVDDFECQTDQPESYTSTRIVRATIESFRLAKKLSCQSSNCG